VLTPKAEHERTWGWIPALGKLLGEQRVPDHYFGPTSVSDNEFKKVQRLMKIYILICENRCEIAKAMGGKEFAKRELHSDLKKVADALEFYAQKFSYESRQVIELAYE